MGAGARGVHKFVHCSDVADLRRDRIYAPHGPIFDLSPGFSDEDAMLLGRLDFFKVFDLSFGETFGFPSFAITER
jgi:hypothetical protein